MTKSKTVFLFGYNGLGNIGDDLMYKGLIDSINDDYEIFTTKKKYKVGNETELTKTLDVAKSILFSDKFVIVGGNVFSYERPKSFIKMLAYTSIFLARKIMGKATEVDSVGLDLKEGKLWRYLVTNCLSMASSVSIRDGLSYRFLRRTGAVSNLKYEFDRVYRERKILFTINSEKSDFVFWWISYPAFKKNSNKLDDVFNQSIKDLLGTRKVYLFCQEHGDVIRSQDIIRKYNLINYEIINYNFDNLGYIIEKFAESNLFVTERYHGAVIAESLKTNWVAIPFSEKLNRLKPNKYKL